MQKFLKLNIVFFALILFLLMAKNAYAAVLQKAPNSLNLVGYWTFNEGTSTIALDYSGNKNKGTLTNGPTWVNGKQGKALSFDGSNNYVDIGNESNFDFERTNTFTASAWVKRNSQGTYDGVLAKNCGAACNYQGWSILLTPSSGAEGNNSSLYANFLYTNSPSNKIVVTSPTNSISLGQWTHIAIVYSGSSVASGVGLYINGVLKTNTVVVDSLSNSMLNNSSVKIGRGTDDADHPFDGLIDDVRIYNRALSAGEIKALYNAGAVKYTPPNNLGLVGYWTFNEGTSTVALDYSGNKNKGTLVNGPTWVNGKQGKALSFDGVNDYVDAGSATSLDDLGPLTFSAWIYPKSSGEGDAGAIVAKSIDWITGKFLMLDNQGGDILSLVFVVDYSTTDLLRRTVDNSYTLNTWQHVVATWDGSSSAANIKIYLNGMEKTYKTTTNGVGSINSDASMSMGVGNTSDFTRTFNGLIDDVRIYNRALTPSEVEGLYNSGAAKFQVPNNSGLVGYWSFNEGTSTIALDYSGNKNKGTLVNGPTWVNGKQGKALSFDGVNDYVFNTSIASLITNNTSGSVSLWFKLQTNQTGTPFYFGQSGTTSNLVRLLYQMTSKIEFLVKTTVDLIRGTIPFTFDTGWHHLIVTVGSSGNAIYLDGVQKTVTYGTGNSSTQKWFSDISSEDTLSFGDNLIGGSNNQFPGLIDDVRIYNRALTADEVLKLYNSGK